jgi:capsular polysaccharide biosynthesis protein
VGWELFIRDRGGLLGGVAGYAVSSLTSLNASVSTATILVTGELSGGQVDSALTSNEYVNQRMSTYAGLATSRVVIAEAARQAGIDAAELDGKVTATNPTDTTLIDLSVQAPTADDAQIRATALVGALTDRIGQIENPNGAPPRVALSTVTTPSRPADPSLLPMMLFVGMGALAGAALGGTMVATMIMRARRLAEWRQMYDPMNYGLANGAAATSRNVPSNPLPAQRNQQRPWVEQRRTAPASSNPESTLDTPS